MRAVVPLMLVIVLSPLAGVVEAAAPVVEYLYPAGGQRGTMVTVTAGGKFEPWPVKAWTSTAIASVPFIPIARPKPPGSTVN